MTNPDHIDFETLSAHADGELNAVAALRVDRHVAECDACRGTLARLRSLTGAARALPRESAPPLDAWARIRNRVTSHQSPVTVRWWHNGWFAAAAAVILVAGSVLLTRTAATSRGPKANVAGAASAAASAAAAATPAALASVDRRYEPTLAELRDVLDSQRGSLAPATVRTLERSLAVIDGAIAEARGALAADPSSASLADMLSGYYQRKVDFLKRATTISSSL